MKNLYEYEGKNVSVVLNDMNNVKGFVSDFLDKEDNDYDYNSILLETNNDGLIEIFENEIKEIHILD